MMMEPELYILSRGLVGENNDDVPEMNFLLQGQYKDVLHGSAAQSILALGNEISKDAFGEAIKKNIANFISSSTNDQSNRLLQALCVGISCLEVFLQNNWTGPKSDISPSDVLPTEWESKQEELKEFVFESLNKDDASIYPLSSHPVFLLLAKHILVDSRDSLTALQTVDWWSFRCLWVQQMILDSRDPDIHQKIKSRLEEVVRNEGLMSQDTSGFLPVLFHLECIHICQYYYEYTEAQEHLQTAKKMAGLEVNLTGALGKRTRFQQEDKAQLFLKVEKTDSDVNRGISDQQETVSGLPKDLMLEDDTVLNNVKFKDAGIEEIPRLSGGEQALIISLCLDHKRKSPKDDLINEELLPYVVSVLQQPQYWSVQIGALALRCKLERSKRRKIERSMMQMQTVVDSFDDGVCPVYHRLQYIYAVNLPPKWDMEKELASLFMDLGSTSAALEVFYRLQLWQDVVDCYKRLGKAEKAIKVIKDQLDIKETVVMRCLLGEVTGKKEHFEQAWEFSNHKSARAQKSLGLHYLREENYEKCIECLEKSLEKNYLQYESWFALGFAALEAKQYETAAKAYRTCVTIETDNFQAWNNLANAYTRLNQKYKAFLSFKEAIKCNYENWKVWENYLVVSVDVGQFSEAIRAYQRLLELKEKFVDEEVLRVLAKIVTDNIHDHEGKPGVDFKDGIAKVFGHLTSQVTNNHRVWELYAQVHGNCLSGDVQAHSKSLQFLQKSHRLLSLDKDCFSNEENIKLILSLTERLAEGYVKYSTMVASSSEAIQTLSSAKLMMKSVIAKAKKSSEELPDTWQEHQSDIADLEAKLVDIQNKISEKKGA
ncbi:putative tetratricopeptide repeat protein 27 [Apostichopus japonicus]|uniref:Putative tetratricopeptide repeat protein 27 n=1 Tax=Stichopus japonicus TaxID=307972 RepID=A0A2G8JNB3_STIJA|nr:putative tetratricopeptide repeat protein 27 [Apostichopus japonicus]